MSWRTPPGKDPLEFRRDLLTNQPRHKAVLELTAEKAGWGTPMAEGHGRGIALHKSFGSFVAQVAEVSVTQMRVMLRSIEWCAESIAARW